jgi:succinate dehydrogenase flavoprotein subunit
MEVGPTSHYMNGGVRVHAETTATTVPGLFAAGEVAGGLHGANRLGENSPSDLVVFGRRAGFHAALYVKNLSGTVTVHREQVVSAVREAIASLARPGNENPNTIRAELQETMQSLVGIIRTASELEEAIVRLERYERRMQAVYVPGGLAHNPVWHTALDLRALITVAEAVARAAVTRKESRGGHTCADYPAADPAFAAVNVVVRKRADELVTSLEPIPPMPAELSKLVEP